MRKLTLLIAASDSSLRRAVTAQAELITPFRIREAISGPDAYQAAVEAVPDLVVTTADLPGYDGLALCHRLRDVPQLRDVPLVVLGPRGDQQRKYQAFFVGATEYMELPFDPTELQWRLRLQLRDRLREDRDTTPIERGALRLEPGTRTASVGDRQAVLTPSEFALLRRLAERPGEPVSAQSLLQEALGQPASLGNPQVIHTHLRNLRKKLEADPANPSLLLKHPAGYLVAVET